MPGDLETLASIEEILDADRKQRYRSSPIKAHHNRTHWRLHHDVMYIARTYGQERLGFLTITGSPGDSAKFTMKKFREGFKTVQQNLGMKLECAWILDRTRAGVFHIHAIVFAPFDIAHGFDHEKYRRMRILSAKADRLTQQEDQERRTLGRSLTANPNLKRLWSSLRHVFGGRPELTPVRNPEAASRYMAGRYCATLRGTSIGKKGMRRIGRTRGFPKNPAPFVTRGQLRHRAFVAAALNAVGLTITDLESRFGTKRQQAWQLILACNALAKRFGPAMHLWPAEALKEEVWKRLGPLDRSQWVSSGPTFGANNFVEDMIRAAQRRMAAAQADALSRDSRPGLNRIGETQPSQSHERLQHYRRRRSRPTRAA